MMTIEITDENIEEIEELIDKMIAEWADIRPAQERS